LKAGRPDPSHRPPRRCRPSRPPSESGLVGLALVRCSLKLLSPSLSPSSRSSLMPLLSLSATARIETEDELPTGAQAIAVVVFVAVEDAVAVGVGNCSASKPSAASTLSGTPSPSVSVWRAPRSSRPHPRQAGCRSGQRWGAGRRRRKVRGASAAGKLEEGRLDAPPVVNDPVSAHTASSAVPSTPSFARRHQQQGVRRRGWRCQSPR